MIEKFKLGQIVNAVGLKGEVKVYPYTDYKERFEELSWVYIENEKADIEKVRYMGELAIIKFKHIKDRNGAEAAKTKYIYIDRENARELPEDTYFISDLIGIEVVDEKLGSLGKLSDVIQNTSQDIYEVEMKNGKKFMIPAVDEFILNVDMDKKVMSVKLIEGMLDI